MELEQQIDTVDTRDHHYTPRRSHPESAGTNGGGAHAARPEERRRDEGARQEEGVPGRLFGWLVNYASPEGSAIELREGKFFVTRTSLKENDLIINDDSVSTPHAMVTVSPETGLQIQDLMSAYGFFFRKRGSDTYHREYYSTLVEHGDWIRFGSVEFLVSLIAHVGVR